MKILFVIIFSFVKINLLSAQTFIENDKAQILTVLENQRQAWNNGDLDSYMLGYWKSDSLKFIGKSGINFGWKKTLANYKKSYPDKNAMGNLLFEVIRLDFFTEDTAMMTGKWIIEREADILSGYFTLIWKKISADWVIVYDHSS